MTKLEQLEQFCKHLENARVEGTAIVRWALEEIKRLKYRINHQTADDIAACNQGRHKDCGK